jgi:two-component system, cell cycle sensor histidine kinase and response regulator CckA
VPPLILVVDDEPSVQAIACRFLQEAGFTTMAVDSAHAALELLEHGVPDLLVIDVLLPDLPGPELALRIHLRYPRVPVLFISGWPDAQATVSHLDPLHWLFVQKPFSGESLARAARVLLGEPSEPATDAVS